MYSSEMRQIINTLSNLTESTVPTINDLDQEALISHYQKNGFTAFRHNNQIWAPKTATAKNTNKLVLNWTSTFQRKDQLKFRDAAFTYARLMINPLTNDIIGAQVQGNAQDIQRKADAESEEKSLKDSHREIVGKIKQAIENDPEVKKHYEATLDELIPRAGPIIKKNYSESELEQFYRDMKKFEPEVEVYVVKRRGKTTYVVRLTDLLTTDYMYLDKYPYKEERLRAAVDAAVEAIGPEKVARTTINTRLYVDFSITLKD